MKEFLAYDMPKIEQFLRELERIEMKLVLTTGQSKEPCFRPGWEARGRLGVSGSIMRQELEYII